MIPPLENVDVDVNNINSLFKSQAIPDNINDYKFENKLGEGRFGKVRSAIHKSTNLKVAIKIIDKNQIKLKEDRQRVDSEISILKQIKHYNISKLFSCIESEERIYLVEEYVNGNDLNVFIKQKEKPKIREQKVLNYFRQIISAIEYVHKLGICHRDLKPENILINSKNDIKLIDFGLGKMFTKGQLLKTQCGSPFYASPEMINGNKYNGFNSDIWSLGVILYLMLFEELPFMDADMKRLYKKISAGKYEIPEDKLDEVSSEAIDLVKQILEVNPKQRIKISEIKSHPWFNQISNVLYEGINTKEIILPIDEEIVEDINKNYGYEKMRIRNNIIRNFYNHITSLYFILLEKKIKQGKESVSDLCSKLYLDYVNDDKNKLINYENIEGILKERMNSKEKLETIPDYEENKEFLNIQKKKNIIGRRRRTQIIDINDICNIQNDSKLNNELIKIKKKKNEKTNRNDNNNIFNQADTNTRNSKFGTFNKTKTHDSDSVNLKDYKQKLSERVNIEINRSINKREIYSDSRRDKSEKLKLSSGLNKKIDNLKVASAKQKKLLTNHNTNAPLHFNNNSITSKSNKIISKSRTNKKVINNMKNKHGPFVSCDESKPIDKKAVGHILYKNNDTGINRNGELYSTNRSLLDKININKKSGSNKNVTNLNKNNINEKSITSPTKSIEVTESKKKEILTFLDNSRSSKIKKRFYINQKLGVSSLANENLNKYKMIQGKTMSNFYKNNINNNYESTKISVKNIKSHNNHKVKTAKIENKTVSMMKDKKTQKFGNFKTNSNFLERKQRNKLNSIKNDLKYLESEKTGNTNISNSTNNLNNVNSAVNVKKKINNENIVASKKVINPYSTSSNFNIYKKGNNKSSLITNFTSREKSNSKDKKIMVNIAKKDSKITSPKNDKTDKILLSTIKKQKNKKRNINLNENKVNLNLNNQANFNEKNIINFENPFDLNCLVISKNKLKIKETFEKYLNHKKINFICEKDKTNNNNKNQICFNCSKKNGAKFSVKLSKIKNEYNSEDINLYICKIKKISDVKYDYNGLINFLSL